MSHADCISGCQTKETALMNQLSKGRFDDQSQIEWKLGDIFILILTWVEELNQIKVLLLNPLVKQFLLHVTIGDLSVAQQYFPLWFSAIL